MRLRSIIRSTGMLFVLLGLTGAPEARSVTDTKQFNPSGPQQGVARTADGKEVGSVIDFIVDPASGRLIFAVVSARPSRTMASSVTFLPWDLGRVDSTGNVFDFMIAASALRDAPRLPMKKWQGTLRPQVLTRIDEYWTTHPKRRSSLLPHSGAALCKATALLGVPVQGETRTVLGTIRQLVLDPDDSAIALVILAQPTSTESSYTEFVKVPWEQIYVEPRAGTIIAFAGSKIVT